MKRKAISQIIGTMLMLAIVVGVGGTIMFAGLSDVGKFMNMLGLFETDRNERFLESFIVEHIRFSPTGNNATITIRNTGNVDITIDSISVVNVVNQELVLNNNTISQKVLVGDVADIEQKFTLTQGAGIFDDVIYKLAEYRVSITTSRANSVEMIAKPFNT